MANHDSDEDDYLSEKFLNPPSSVGPGRTAASPSKAVRMDLTYAERRREAQRISDLKNQAGRRRSRKEVEEEARREGLSRSLFERAREEVAMKKRRVGDDDGDEDTALMVPPKNKAMDMMLKMGFKEGESLGKKDQDGAVAEKGQRLSVHSDSDAPSGPAGPGALENKKTSTHLIEPLPLAIWAGRKGLGLGKRTFAVEPKPKTTLSNGIVPIDSHVQESQDAYRARVREEHERGRAVGRLVNARKTLIDLDEKNGIVFNIIRIDPLNTETIPPELLYLLDDLDLDNQNHDTAARLRAQMQRDTLQTLDHNEDPLDGGRGLPLSEKAAGKATVQQKVDMTFDEDTLQDTRDWLQLSVQDRLRFTLEHLRSAYYYCFWCGAKYEDEAELEELCPGVDEEAHD
ncbi:hypothetical protein FRB97_005091 [Tulasnella sp. 331]|nr:hypothetical protein FRB97_005091 [Tulasnella sp. 331]